MKTPLRFQLTEYDCGTESILNALAYLYERKELPADLIRGVFNYTLDQFGNDSRQGTGGTSRAAMELLTNFFNEYAQAHHFSIRTQHHLGESVDESLFKKHLSPGSVAVTRLQEEGDHYALVTKIADEQVFIFDPYYVEDDYYDSDAEVTIIQDQPKSHNRLVSTDRFFANSHKSLALGHTKHREALIISRSKS